MKRFRTFYTCFENVRSAFCHANTIIIVRLCFKRRQSGRTNTVVWQSVWISQRQIYHGGLVYFMIVTIGDHNLWRNVIDWYFLVAICNCNFTTRNKKKQCLSRYIHTVILVALACHKPAAMLDKILFYFDSRHTFTIIVATKIQIHEDVQLTHSQGRDMVSHTNR